MSPRTVPALPAPVLAFAERGPAWSAFVDALPGRLRDLVAEWSLMPTGEVWWGYASVVLPVHDADGAPRVLKVAFPDIETEHEALALQRWGGRGAVRLLRADPHRRALLLERLERRDLTQEWDVAACQVVGELYGRLHVPAPPQLMLLADYVAGYRARLLALPRDAPLPRRLVEQAAAHIRDLARDLRRGDPSTAVLVHGDLHYENVLARQGEWVAIDPHAMSGDPHFEPAPLLWNRWEEMAGDVRRAVRARLEAVVDAAGLDERRAVAWCVVRFVLGALWLVEEAPAGVRSLDPAQREQVTRMVTLAKAVQP
ncbi:aminoglycoside phosphotransferase family protein [Nocardioides acrostichi]|uniref:Aminoglycoside resistance protein n=1 Tax=Nocardioides acrostichi TaxID=2784339 RepID=A0A930V3I3_9ACTN|nr:aminoglycoside phosphotransferase family protein [Nocardioides acrostichi]MBF4163334.1 aminoglycoside resistance protein [Nocardioides acrostichi]